MADRSAVIAAFISVHKEIQATLGHEGEITEDTCPLDDERGFSSTLIPVAIRMVARELGIQLDRGSRVKNLYADRTKKLKLSEVAERFIAQYGEGSHG